MVKPYLLSEFVSIATETNISSSTYSLERVAGGDGLTKVTEGTSIYYLYPKERQGGTFSGSVAGNSAVLASVRSRGLGSLAGIRTIIKNANNPVDTQEVTTAADGSFTVPDAIPGDTYTIVPVIGDTEAPAVTVKPLDSGNSVGTVTVSDAAYNFKASTVYPTGTPFLFADGATDYTLTINIANSGTQTSASPTYTATSASSGLTLSGVTLNNMQSIEAGSSRSFTVTVRAEAISGDYEDKKINIKLEIYEGATWEDSVTIRFWKNDRLPIYFSSEYGARLAIITPEGRLVSITNGNVEIPRRASGIKIALSGASTTSETKYGLSLGTNKSPSWTTYVNPGKDEPNNLPAQATPLYINDPSATAHYGYLRPNDMDFFEVKSAGLDTPVVAFGRSVGGDIELSWPAVTGAESYFVRLNGVDQFAAGTTSTTVTIVTTATSWDIDVYAFSTTKGYSLPAERFVFHDKGSVSDG